jgi:HD-like signal output (HDOD) protein
MKARAALTASEVESLWQTLERRLDDAGLPTQPEVASKVLSLVSDPGSTIRAFADIIRTDAALSGRLLRFANSAFFAQRQPVTNLERACVLLGLERLKAVSLGFSLCRAAASDQGQVLSRRVWGESVYRGCLAAELAREMCPAYAPEAFVIGLLVDSGIPIAFRLLGSPYRALLEANPNPAALFQAESAALPFTHVDIATALARRWRLPEMLSRPIQRHHTTPKALGRENAVQQLHRVSYYAGAVELGAEHTPEEPAPAPAIARRVLGIDQDQLTVVVRRATLEYTAIFEVFREFADRVGGPEEIAARVHRQLVGVTDRMIMGQLAKAAPSSGYFDVAGHRVEVEVDQGGRAVAYLADDTGRRLLAYAFKPGEQTARGVLDGLGLESAESDEADHLETYLRSIAA